MENNQLVERVPNKAQIRTGLRTKRLKLKPPQVKFLSKKIIKACVDTIDWQKVKTLHTYTSISKLGEVGTKSLIEFVKEEFPNTLIYHPEDEPKTLDVIVVPLVAFDLEGNRIGMGGGYYDRFLKRYPKAQKIGLAYEFQKVDEIPAEPHDIRLNAVVTEKQTYTF